MNLPNCGNDIRSPEAEIEVCWLCLCFTSESKWGRALKQRTVQSAEFPAVQIWRLKAGTCVIFISLSSSTQTFPSRGFLIGGCPPSSLAALPQPNKVARRFLTNVWRSSLCSFMLSTSCLWREAPLTWPCLLAGRVVYSPDSGLPPSVRGTSSPRSHVILPLAAQCLITEDKSSPGISADAPLLSSRLHQTLLLFLNEATTIRATLICSVLIWLECTYPGVWSVSFWFSVFN